MLIPDPTAWLLIPGPAAKLHATVAWPVPSTATLVRRILSAVDGKWSDNLVEHCLDAVQIRCRNTRLSRHQVCSRASRCLDASTGSETLERTRTHPTNKNTPNGMTRVASTRAPPCVSRQKLLKSRMIFLTNLGPVRDQSRVRLLLMTWLSGSSQCSRPVTTPATTLARLQPQGTHKR